MRFQTEYTCGLMNAARHASFGMEAAKNVLASVGTEWPKVVQIMEARLMFISHDMIPLVL